MTGTAVARRLNMSKSAVSRAVVWGEKIASDMKLEVKKGKEGKEGDVGEILTFDSNSLDFQ